MHLEAMLAVRPISRVRVWSRTSDHALRFAGHVAPHHDVPIEAMEVLRAKSAQIWTGGAEAMRALLRDEVRTMLTRPLPVTPFSVTPWVVFVVGVNGVGKTTTIG